MTIPSAALPGGRRQQAPTTYSDHGVGEKTPAGCPMCQATDKVFVHTATPAEYEVEVTAIGGVSRPELDVISVHVPEPERDPKKILKIECRHCHWTYTGPDPLSRLVEVPA